MKSFFVCSIKILTFALSVLKSRFLKKIITFWFHKLLYCFKPWNYRNRYATSSVWMDLKTAIFEGSFIKINKLLLVKRLLWYVQIISTCFIIKFNKHNITRNILHNFLFTVDKNVLFKLVLWTWKNLAPSVRLYVKQYLYENDILSGISIEI